MDAPVTDITGLLADWSKGDASALDRLMPLVYAELRRIASQKLRNERPDLTLRTTDLVHEAYLRLVRSPAVACEGRRHFYGIASRLVRQILVDHARSHNAQKRGPNVCRLAEIGDVSDAGRTIDVLSLSLALDDLETFDPEGCRIVEMRFFGGLGEEDIAETTGWSRATVQRKWYLARLWLFQRLTGQSTGGAR